MKACKITPCPGSKQRCVCMMMDQAIYLVPGPDCGASSSSDNDWQDVHHHKAMPMGPVPDGATPAHQRIGSNFIIFSHLKCDTNWTAVVECDHQGPGLQGLTVVWVYFCTLPTARYSCYILLFHLSLNQSVRENLQNMHWSKDRITLHHLVLNNQLNVGTKAPYEVFDNFNAMQSFFKSRLYFMHKDTQESTILLQSCKLFHWLNNSAHKCGVFMLAGRTDCYVTVCPRELQ